MNKKNKDGGLMQQPKDRKEIEEGKSAGEPIPPEDIPSFSDKDYIYDPEKTSPPKQKWGSSPQIVLAGIIAIVVSLVIVWMFAPSKTAYQADITRLEIDIVQMRNAMPDIGGINTRLGTLENRAGVIEEKLDNFEAPDIPDFSELEGQVTSLSNETGALSNRIGELEELINEGGQGGNSLSYYLTGNFGNYKLHVKPNMTGSYVCRVTLVYLNPKEIEGANINAATRNFYGEWLTNPTPGREFTPTLKWNVTNETWELRELYFYTASFSLEAGEDVTLNIPFSGPKTGEGYSHYAFAEVFPLLGVTPEEIPENVI